MRVTRRSPALAAGVAASSELGSARGIARSAAAVGRSRARALILLVWCALICLLWSGLAPTRALAAPPQRTITSPLDIGLGLDDDLVMMLIEAPEVEAELYGQPIVDVRFRGNRRVESEAMLLEITSGPGKRVDARTLAADLRRLWELGYFDDVSVEGELGKGGVVLTFIVTERSSIRKIIVEGNQKVKLDDINEELDLAKNEVLDQGKVKRNVEKIRQLYTDQGFFLAEVNYSVRDVEDEPGKVDVIISVTESSEVVVREIVFVGNRAVTDDELRKAMFTRIGGYMGILSKKGGGVFNRDAFSQDYSNIRSFYGDRGYLDADVADGELALSPDRRFVHITIPVEEGPQYHMGEIRARELVARGEKELFPEDVLNESIEPVLAVGDVASTAKIRMIQQDIERRYKDNGYAYVNVVPSSRQDRDTLKVFLIYEVQKGPLVYIERINILGNDKTAEKVIRRELALQEGDLYSEGLKEASENRVLRLGYFTEADISSSRGSAEDKIILNVEVTERLTGTFQVGAGFSTIEAFVLQAQIQYDNFLGRGSTVQLVGQLSRLRRLFNLRYYTRYFLDSKFQFDFNIFNSSNFFVGFQRQSTGFSVQWGWPIPRLRNLVLWAGYDFEWVKASFGSPIGGAGIFAPGAVVSVPTGSLVSNLFNNGITSALSTRIVYDSRDNFLFPTKGTFQQISAQFSEPWLGAQNLFHRYNFDSRFYVPLIKTDKSFRAWVVFKTRMQVGYVHGPRDRGVPVFERFFPGGIYGSGQIRGYRLRSLGAYVPVLSSPDPAAQQFAFGIGGNLLTAFTAEIEAMLIPPANIKAVIFMDVGNAFNTESHYCEKADPDNLPKADPCVRFALRSLRISTGFGFRWQSPIGPLRFEWGFPLDRRKFGTNALPPEDPVVFEFNVGTGF